MLRNKLGIRDADELSSVEVSITFAKMISLDNDPVKGDFDSKHLQEIHRRLFSEIYEWAGEFRTVEISKGLPFCFCANIQNSLDDLLSELKRENYLRDICDRNAMTKRLAYYLVEMNVIHPFREGNGRVQRKFIEQLAKEAGFELNLDGIESNEMIAASQEGMVGNYIPMESIIRKSLNYRMQDVMECAHGSKTPNAQSWKGHMRSEIGLQIEKLSSNAFNVQLTKIDEPDEFSVPDYIDLVSGACIEVFSGESEERVVDIVSEIPIVKVRKNTASNHIIDALTHTKHKFNSESELYIKTKYNIDKQLTKIAMCSMDCTDYLFLDHDSIKKTLKGVHLSNYGLDALVVYFIPAGLNDTSCGGNIYVFYENDIDKTIFSQDAVFTRI